MKPIRWLLLASTIVATACSCSSSTDPIPLSALNGQWTPNNPEVPGLSYQFTLVLVDTHLTGSGQWSVGSQSGSVAVTGSTTDNAVSLDLTLGHDSPGTLPFLIEHFDGQLKSSSALTGTVTFSGGGGQQTYRKTGS